MPPASSVEGDVTSASDSLLAEFLTVEDAASRERALRVLLEREAAPIIRGVLLRKSSGAQESEDITSAAREQLIRQLDALRTGQRETPIRDFRNYVAGVAYSAWAEHLRNENPERSMLLNRIRYLLENRTARRGFALWEGEHGRKWCGLPQWSKSSTPLPTPRLQWLLNDPVAAARDAFRNRYWERNELHMLVAELFEWLGTPIELRDLVFVVAEILEICGRTDASRADAAEVSDSSTVADQSSAAEQLIWKEYLLWLWQQLAKLPPRQCAAFLLNSSVLRDFELLGIASIRSLAPRFGMPPERLAMMWQRLPLDDRQIASELQCARQQVINLRRVARDSLSRAWRAFSGETKAAGNNRPRFASSSV